MIWQSSQIMPTLSEWDSFYVIIGSAAGGLIGLQFVVLTLIAERPRLRLEEAGAAFSTPNIVHFCTALLLSAIQRVPWKTIGPAAFSWGLMGFFGAIYAIIFAWRMRTQPVYRPEFEDWLFYALLPLIGYAIVIVSAFTAYSRLDHTLFAVGFAALLFLFLGIRNAWDSISYHVFHPPHEDGPRLDKPSEKRVPRN